MYCLKTDTGVLTTLVFFYFKYLSLEFQSWLIWIQLLQKPNSDSYTVCSLYEYTE